MLLHKHGMEKLLIVGFGNRDLHFFRRFHFDLKVKIILRFNLYYF